MRGAGDTPDPVIRGEVRAGARGQPQPYVRVAFPVVISDYLPIVTVGQQAGGVDTTTFYALFSATCFTLVGLWWNVVSARPAWLSDPDLRRSVGGVYVAFLIPAMMGLFAQVGGTTNPDVWRSTFVVFAVIGALSTLSLLSRGGQGPVVPLRVGAGLLYVLIALVGVRPETAADLLDLRPIEVEALLLILLVGVGHALAWRFMTENAGVDESGGDRESNRHG